MITWTYLLCVLTPALCCDWLKHYGHLSNLTLTLIRHMGGPLTKDQSPVPFPRRLYKDIRKAEVETQLVFIRGSLDEIFKLYHRGNLSSVTWDADKTHHFLIIVNRQKNELSKCVPKTKRADRRLRRYYRRLAKSTLYHTGFSAVSWELIRNQTKRHLDQLDMLVNQIKHSSAASRRRSAAAVQHH